MVTEQLERSSSADCYWETLKLHVFTILFYKHLKILKRMGFKCHFKPEKLYHDFSACVEAFVQSFTLGYKKRMQQQ